VLFLSPLLLHLISHELFHTLAFGSRVVLTVTFQKVDNAPDTKTCAQGHYESLQNTNCAVEKFHKIILLKNVFDFGLSCCVNLVHIEGVRGFYHGTLLLHVPFHVKDIFRVGVGRVSVIRVPGEVVLVRKERAHAPQHEDTLAAVHHCQFVLGHQLFATMSSDELKKQVTIKEIYLS